ncbi:EamA family transporter RarD [Avibacterium sp. 21-595]|uniref:EamA family transporter RarD n=1 Tax=Avibacterium sp. 21-595 TaxID=2911527 RepID=UPI002025C55B|nr:EamA family transporter RarD [Avibacterium sp. 21-595]URL07530.1 EamA family transporter RarD [Avibacterium sp. 21-595]
MNPLNEQKAGLIYALITMLIWGLTPLVFKLLQGVGATEIIVFRILFSLLLLLIFISLNRQWQSVKTVIGSKRSLLLLLMSGSTIALAWDIYIYAIITDRMADAALGNFIAPIVQMVLGFWLFGERLSPVGKTAFVLVILAVALEIFLAGNLPWIAVCLAVFTALYATLRKKAAVGAMAGLLVETTLMLPFALGYLAYYPTHFAFDLTGFLLFLCGVLTLVPLITFNLAALRLPLNTLAMLQYLTPSLVLMLAVFVYHEPVGGAKLAAFALIWLAIFLVSVEGVRKNRRKMVKR